ncbi:MAG: gliding motility protein GldC [Bacteroidota bacterium]
MSKSKILFEIELDKDSVPERITWEADQKETPGASETRAISIALWDQDQNNTLRIDLWDKQMPVDDMKRFYVDCLGGMAQSILNSTGDDYMSSEINELCDRLVKHIREENQRQ